MKRIEFDLDIDNQICEPEVTYKVNRELNLAWEIIEETGANLFLTGRAGTGKTTFLKRLREDTGKRLVVLAPTGVAAINASGTTLHSFFQLPFAPFVPGKGFLTSDRKFVNMSRQKKRLIASLSLLVIDEISMVRPDTLDAVDSMLRRLRHSPEPFGGVQLLLIGDIRQLPPVVKEDEWQQLKEYYPTPYFFESHALKSAGFITVELSTVYRQSDRVFLDILNSIRDGKATPDVIETLNSRFNPLFNPPDEEGYIRLTTHNRSAAAINERRLAALPTPEFSFPAEVEGEFPETAFPAEKSLRLKKGAQVMFIKNDVGAARRFYNGMIGIVTELSEDKICVCPHGSSEIIEVERMEWENTRFLVDEADGRVVQESIGTFSQYPLQLAWAITIHKSQGLTFDRAIIDAMHSFAPGQTYVALSRCRTLEGLVLNSPVPPGAVITDSNVAGFVNYYENNSPGADLIERLKNEYTFRLISELYDFETLKRVYADFSRYAFEYLVPPFPDIEPKLSAWKEEIEKNLLSVASRFLYSYRDCDMAAEFDSPGSQLRERIKRGCTYFLEILRDFEDFLYSLPRDIGNRGYAERLDNTFAALSDQLVLKIALLSRMAKTGFSIPAFIHAKALATLDLEKSELIRGKSGNRWLQPEGKKKTKSPERKKARKNTTDEEIETRVKEKTVKKVKTAKEEKKPKGYSTFETLRLFKEGKSISQIAEERNLKTGTIESHLSDLIAMERLSLEEVAGTPLMLEVRTIVENNPDAEMADLCEMVGAHMSRKYLPGYIRDYIQGLKNSRL